MQAETETHATDVARPRVLKSMLRVRGTERERRNVTFADRVAGRPLAVLHEYESESVEPTQVKSSSCCAVM